VDTGLRGHSRLRPASAGDGRFFDSIKARKEQVVEEVFLSFRGAPKVRTRNPATLIFLVFLDSGSPLRGARNDIGKFFQRPASLSLRQSHAKHFVNTGAAASRGQRHGYLLLGKGANARLDEP
jgi:hypothetical protein